jgi:TRAP-type mannitol/chloroaromatic compound transport system substrate-binding protein
VAAGVQVRVYSRDILNAAFDATEQIYAGLNAKNPRFEKIFGSWNACRREEPQWLRVNELGFGSFAAGRYSR